MKKYPAIVLSLIMLISLTSCSNGSEQTGTTTTTKGDDNSNVVVIDTTTDTSDEALEYLSSVVPLFTKYIRSRRTTPVTMETTIETESGTYISNIYIKDADHAVEYTVDPSGNETRVIFSGTMAHQIESATKTVYSQELGKIFVQNSVSEMMLPLDVSDVNGAVYSQGTGKIGDIEYNCEGIQMSVTDADGNITATYQTVYYFDKETDKLVYSDSNGTLTKIEKLENTFDREDLFEIPSDYKVLSVDELREQVEGGSAAEASN